MCRLRLEEPGMGELESRHLLVHALRRVTQETWNACQQGQEPEHGPLGLGTGRQHEEQWKRGVEPTVQPEERQGGDSD